MIFGTEQFFSEQHMELLCRDETCSIYQMRNETGEGLAALYPVYQGIFVMYNDFHMATCPPRQFDGQHYLIIQHCLEGRAELEAADGTYVYLAEGDTMIESFSVEYQYCCFPLSHFHGITIILAVKEVLETMGDFLRMFQIDLEEMEMKFSLSARPFILHNDGLLNHVFAGLYQVPEIIKGEYLKVKVLEALIALKAIDTAKIDVKRPYFYKTQVEKVKAIMSLITKNPDKHYTINELSAQFDLSVSALKTCFKGVYGMAIYTYLKNYRMNIASEMLTQTDKSIAEIAGEVGYCNSSKFARAFKAVKGQTPMAYRKRKS